MHGIYRVDQCCGLGDDGRAFGRRERVGEEGELLVCRTSVEMCDVGNLVGDLAGASVRVDRDPRRDRHHPGAEMLAVPEPVVGSQRPQERLLERVVRPLVPESAAKEAEHLAGMLGVEHLERRDRRHGHHHPVKRSTAAGL